MTKQINELLLQSLEHELGGVKIYETAIQCAQRETLQREWTNYLEETRTHVQILRTTCEQLALDPEEQTPGRAIVRHLGNALVEAMQMAIAAGDPTAAELIACECIVLAETKDHFNWELISKAAGQMEGKPGAALTAASNTVENQEDEHLYHTKGWCRELWLASLGINAVLPPPEERQKVKTAIGAARAEQAADRAR